jgi:hypothetical protein
MSRALLYVLGMKRCNEMATTRALLGRLLFNWSTFHGGGMGCGA